MPCREPGGCEAFPRAQGNLFSVPVPIWLTSPSLGFGLLWYHPLQGEVAGVEELDFME